MQIVSLHKRAVNQGATSDYARQERIDPFASSTYNTTTLDGEPERIARRSMKKDLLRILACPMCKGELTLAVHEQHDDEVAEGALACPRCRETYPIRNSIPNLLPPHLRV